MIYEPEKRPTASESHIRQPIVHVVGLMFQNPGTFTFICTRPRNCDRHPMTFFGVPGEPGGETKTAKQPRNQGGLCFSRPASPLAQAQKAPAQVEPGNSQRKTVVRTGS